MKRAVRERQEQALAEHAREAAELLALQALLDHRIPDSERLVRDMKDPRFLDELRDRGRGSSGATRASDVVARYSRVIAQRTGGNAESVRQHFTGLIGKQQAADLGVNPGRMKITDRPLARGGVVVQIMLNPQEAVAIAGYLASPQHLNLGNLPVNPFGSPKLADLMNQLQALNRAARTAPEFTYGLSPTSAQLRDEAGKLTDVVVHELSRTLPDNEARRAALKAMRLDDCLEIYRPGVLGPSGIVPGTAEQPTRYRIRANHRDVTWRLLDFYQP